MSDMTLNNTPAPSAGIKLAETAGNPALRGIALYCLALVLFTGMGITAKSLAAIYPVEQVVWGRYFFHVLLIVAIFPTRVLSLFKTEKLGLQITRSVLVFMATVFGFTSLSSTSRT